MALYFCRQRFSLSSLLLTSKTSRLGLCIRVVPLIRRFYQDVTYDRAQHRLPYIAKKDLKNVRHQPVAPFGVRKRKQFSVNDDPETLNNVYVELVGNQITLTEDIKWQAVTHKSFDHGRQPFNEKLAFFGRILLQMHASIHILSSPRSNQYDQLKPFVYKSSEGNFYQATLPFIADDYKNLNAITRFNVETLFNDTATVALINKCGLLHVMRWKSAQAGDFARSGQMVIARECLYAIVAATALQKGGIAATQFIQTKIMPSKEITKPL